MADYSQVNDYSAKDALATGDPLKLIKGSDIDSELAAISTAIASKFDSTDIATAAEAQAGTNNTKVITPARLTAWGQNDAGIIEDLQALADPNADRILFWDDSAGTTTFLTVGTGLQISATTISVDETGFARQVIAGESLSGGGALSSDVTLDLDINENTAAAIASGDFLVFADVSDSNISKKITFANLEATLSAANLSGGVSTATVLTAGTGLSYSVGGTNIGTTSTIDLDINELTAETTVDGAADYIPMYDNSAGGIRKVLADAFVGTELGDGKWYRNAAANATSTLSTLAFDTELYDSLTRGTFSTSTGEYTAGASGARVLVTAQMYLPQIETDDALIQIQNQGVAQASGLVTNRGGYGLSSSTVSVTTVVNMSAGDVLRVRISNDTTRALTTGRDKVFISIVELA